MHFLQNNRIRFQIEVEVLLNLPPLQRYHTNLYQS